MPVRIASVGLIVIGMLFATHSVADGETVFTDEADSLYVLAGELYVEGRYADAVPLFLRVVELKPQYGNAHALLGGSYLHLGDYGNAIGAFERAIELDDGIRLAYLGLVAANYFTERMEAAELWLERLVSILSGDERSRYLATIS
ncbi:MAG: tetratricopeptide repeat protein, partial [Gemmatimonadota bacterium]